MKYSIINSLTTNKMKLSYFSIILICSGILAVPLNNNKEDHVLSRTIRSIFKKKPLAHLLGGLGGGSGGGHGGGGNYITNINNYGPDHQSYNPHLTGGHEYGGGSFAGSAAAAGGYGGNSQSQSASFAFGPYAASFSQSQAQGGSSRSGYDPYSDY